MPLDSRGPFLLLFAVDRQLGGLLDRAMAEAPLRPEDFAVTSALRLLGPIRPTGLAAATGLRPTTLSNYLRRLEGDGLIRRRPDPDDGRAALVALTPRGVRLTTQCFPAFQEAIGAFREELDAQGVAERDLIATLEAVSRALAAATTRLGGE